MPRFISVAPTPRSAAHFGGSTRRSVWCRTRHFVVMVVRHPDGRLVLRSLRYSHPRFAQPIWASPGLRIWVRLLESLRWSAETWAFERQVTGRSLSVIPPLLAFSAVVFWIIGIPSIAMDVWAPVIWRESDSGRWLGAGVEALARLGQGLLLPLLFRALPPARQALRQEGARARALHAMERREDLTIENARRHAWVHPRSPFAGLWCWGMGCVLLLAFVDPWAQSLLFEHFGHPGPWVSAAAAVLTGALTLMLGAVGGELAGFWASHRERWWVALLGWPLSALQAAFAMKPEDERAEVALAALRQGLRIERGLPSPARAQSPVRSEAGDEEEFEIERLEELGGIQPGAADFDEI
ncbi:MAG: DUF1385 domain-containing protein [Bdellovibrionales bacterium]|nr:DUF1385 domain-containing protein [Bdellovibrionales bacterium]